MPRLQREYSFGVNESLSSLVLSKEGEQRIANGELSLKSISPTILETINKTIASLVDSFNEAEKDIRHKNVIDNNRISHKDSTLEEINKIRYKDYFDGLTVANSVQYIPIDLEYLSSLSDEMCESILHLFVITLIEYINDCNHTNESEIITWATKFLKKIGKILLIDDHVIDSIIKPISQMNELKLLGVRFDDILQKKQSYIDYIKNELVIMQPLLDEVYKETICTFKRDPVVEGEEVSELKEKVTPPEQEPGFKDDISTSQKKSKNLPNKIIGGISKQFYKALALYSDTTTKKPITRHSSNTSIQYEEWDEELVNETPPTSEAVFARNLITKYILGGNNDARVQILFQNFFSCIGVAKHTMVSLENHLAADLIDALDSTSVKSSTKRMSRNLKILSATVGGGALLALTAGMATPVVAAGIAMLGLGGGGISAYLSSAEGTSIVASVLGTGGTGLSEWKGSKKLDILKRFDFVMLHEQVPKSLGLVICVDGSTTDTEIDWERAIPLTSSDLYLLKWETKLLTSLHNMVKKLGSQTFAENAKTLWIKNKNLNNNNINWPLDMIQYTNVLDNAWLVARKYAEHAGNLLANVICDKQIVGERHISLVGYSMGARVILYALLKLHERGKFFCIKDVIFMGLPSSAGSFEFDMCKSVVAGRLINVYSGNDWILGFLYRYIDINMPIAGLGPVNHNGVENWDASEIITIHSDYITKLHSILTDVNVDL